MKRYLTLLCTILMCICLLSCGKSGSPAPDQTNTNTNTGGSNNGGTNNGGTNNGGTGTGTDNTPIFEVSLAYTFVINMNGSSINNLKIGIYVPALNAKGLLFKTGGNIKQEYRNIPTGDISSYETDGYATNYYPANVFKEGDTPNLAKDTLDHVFAKITDPSYKDATTGRQKIKIIFLIYVNIAGGGSIGVINTLKNDPVKGSVFTAWFNRNDYLAY